VKQAWAYQLPPAGADASGLEDNQVETSDGQVVGRVLTVLERDGKRCLVFDMGLPPLVRARRAVAWEDIEAVDHDTLTTRIRLPLGDLASLPELDHGNEVEDAEAEAMRVTDSRGAYCNGRSGGVRAATVGPMPPRSRSSRSG
jgi:hypothetical protein